jgi:hypothetical protein
MVNAPRAFTGQECWRTCSCTGLDPRPAASGRHRGKRRLSAPAVGAALDTLQDRNVREADKYPEADLLALQRRNVGRALRR